MARKRKIAAAVFSIGCLHAGTLMALGLGELTLDSFLNEPLKASVNLQNMEGLHEEQIRIRLATTEDFGKLGVERAYFLTTLKFDVVSDGAGNAKILISSEQPVLEPYLDFIVEARWPTGRLLREYTVLVDPPVYSQTPTVVSASQRVAEIEGTPAPDADALPVKKKAAVGLFPDHTQGETSGSSLETSGTRVDVRESSLAPGAMPQRNYNASAATSPAPGARYMISRDDTLWDIANRAKPAGTSVHQTMLDIQRLNPDAFINGNINRIKAGYIVYLPTADDISSTDLPSALAEVREQNAAWREGRDAELYASGGPSLRISAEPEEDAGAQAAVAAGATATGTDDPMAGAQASPDGDSPAESGEMAPGSDEAGERLAAVEEQLETLKRIVSLKDDQIAALQSALAEAGVESVEDIGEPSTQETAAVETPGDMEESAADEPVSGESTDEAGAELLDESAPEGVDDIAAVEDFPAAVEEAAGESSVVVASPEPVADANAPAEPVEPAPAPRASEGGWSSYLYYIVGALVLGIVGLVIARRRGNAADDAGVARSSDKDVFSDVQLKQQSIAVKTPAAQADIPEHETSAGVTRDNRGYGERKHDEYASDIDASDALAEADIYIAYGRHPQAIDLLNNALNAEPSNPVYRLKLLEIYNELNDRTSAAAQLDKIRAGGDPDAIARAEALMAESAEQGGSAVSQFDSVRTPERQTSGLSQGFPGPDAESGDNLESDFSGLKIEDSSGSASVDEDLDLSGDFASDEANGADDEELVIADDSNGLSTKLDLARAYLDMGDDDGARQILEEVIAEGSDDLKIEARALLERIGR